MSHPRIAEMVRIYGSIAAAEPIARYITSLPPPERARALATVPSTLIKPVKRELVARTLRSPTESRYE